MPRGPAPREPRRSGVCDSGVAINQSPSGFCACKGGRSRLSHWSTMAASSRAGDRPPRGARARRACTSSAEGGTAISNEGNAITVMDWSSIVKLPPGMGIPSPRHTISPPRLHKEFSAAYHQNLRQNDEEPKALLGRGCAARSARG